METSGGAGTARVNYLLGRRMHDEVWAVHDGGGRTLRLLERLCASWGCAFMDGAGWIFAQGVLERVLHDTLQAGEGVAIDLAAVTRSGQFAGHAVVRVDTPWLRVYLDSDGISTEQELLGRFQGPYGAPDARLCPFSPDAFREAEYPRDQELAAELAEILLARLGPLPASRLAVETVRTHILAQSLDELAPLTSAQLLTLLREAHTAAWLEAQGRRADLLAYRSAVRAALPVHQRLRKSQQNAAAWGCAVSLEEEAGLRIRGHALSAPGLVEVEAASAGLADTVRRELARIPALRVLC